MILVVGSTGMVGGEVCRLLAEKGFPFRALVRATSDPGKVEALKKLGGEVVVGDLRDSGSLKAACQGVKAVIDTASSMPFGYVPGVNTPAITDQAGALALVAEAKAAGVEQFVYISFPGFPASFPLQDAKRAVEQALVASGLTYTILQPTNFDEVWISSAVGFDFTNHKATIYGDGKNKISWISFLDVAQFAVASLGTEAACNVTLQLGGPEGISPLEVVKTFEQVGGKPFEVTHVPVEALQAQYNAAEDPLQKSFAAMMLTYPLIQPIDMTTTLQAFPLKLRTVEEYAKSVMA
jgi:uncharacterized protein YbjT (DUF2867 family)